MSLRRALADKKEVDPLRQENFDRPNYLNSVTPADTDRRVDRAAETVQPRLTKRHHGGIALPAPWDHKRIADLTEMMRTLLDAADLDDDAAEEVCVLVLSKLWQRLGLDEPAFRAAVSAAIASSEAAFSPRRH